MLDPHSTTVVGDQVVPATGESLDEMQLLEEQMADEEGHHIPKVPKTMTFVK